MSTILLSIKPEYVKRIFEGTKKFEFRKHLAQKDVSKIVVYSTFPEMKVVGEVQVNNTLSMPKTPLWELTKNDAGISRSKYRKYFEKSTVAHAYALGKTKVYETPRQLKDYGILQAPQSFVYLKECPYCKKVLFTNDSHSYLYNCKSEEHIIPKSLGNDELILPRGIICDDCNNYFAREIEKPFLENEAIKLLRTYHTIPSRKGKIPPLEVMIDNGKTQLEFDAKHNCAFIGLEPKTINKIISGESSCFFSLGLDTEMLKNNYTVSRFLVKVFTEIYLFLAYQNFNQKDDKLISMYDQKMRELFDYVRMGDKSKKIYEYTVTEYKNLQILSDDNFISSIKLCFDGKQLTGMTLKLFNLKFDLTL